MRCSPYESFFRLVPQGRIPGFYMASHVGTKRLEGSPAVTLNIRAELMGGGDERAADTVEEMIKKATGEEESEKAR